MPQLESLPQLSDEAELKKALETLLFITDRPLSLAQLCKVTGGTEPARVEAVIAELRRELEEKNSPVQLLEVAEGFQMATRPAYAPFVRQLFSERMTMRLSTAALETLAIIAYKQPLTRAEIEEVRGVEVIAALETLLEKRLVKVVGRRETVGRPLMYGTTMEFLRHFGLKSLEELPPLENFSAEAEKALAAAPAAPESSPVPDAPADVRPVEQPAPVTTDENTDSGERSGPVL
ncbi:MAG: SMC-Scp complex subunit ScpB [Elusimicrobia bacterium]|nr:SMC-Scp complex subunit ScpB [Elusimicrobiota bacterium]